MACSPVDLISFWECLIYFRKNRDRMRHVRMQCQEGVIEFYHEPDIPCDTIAIYYVEVINQRCGVFSAFMQKLFEDTTIKHILVLGVSNWNMINCLNKLEYDNQRFYDQGGDFLWHRSE